MSDEVTVSSQDSPVHFDVPALPGSRHREEGVAQVVPGDTDGKLTLGPWGKAEERGVVHIAEKLVLGPGQGVSQEDLSPERPWHRETEPEDEALPPPSPRGELEEPVPGAEERQGAADPGLEHGRVGERQRERVDVSPEVPPEMTLFGLAEEVRLVVPEESGKARPAPDGRPEIDRGPR